MISCQEAVYLYEQIINNLITEHHGKKTTGQTKDTGFEIGVRRTFDIPVMHAWDMITSDEGVKLWIGDVSGLKWEKGETYTTKDGTEGEIRVINPGSHLRITWWPKEWDKGSTIQIGVIPKLPSGKSGRSRRAGGDAAEMGKCTG